MSLWPTSAPQSCSSYSSFHSANRTVEGEEETPEDAQSEETEGPGPGPTRDSSDSRGELRSNWVEKSGKYVILQCVESRAWN